MATETQTLPETVYLRVQANAFAGVNSPEPVVAASIDPDDPAITAGPGEADDGWHASTRVRYVVREYRKPKSIATLERDFGERVVFGLAPNGVDLGCWIDGKAHRYDAGRWTWTAEESAYLEAVYHLPGLWLAGVC